MTSYTLKVSAEACTGGERVETRDGPVCAKASQWLFTSPVTGIILIDNPQPLLDSGDLVAT